MEVDGKVSPVALNIKDESVRAAVRERAALTGESQTRAVATAVRSRLEQLHDSRAEPLAERMLDIGRACAAEFDEGTHTLDHGDLLYDEAGLPR